MQFLAFPCVQSSPLAHACVSAGHGSVDLLSYTSAPFTLHSITPPRHVMEELAASIQGQLQLRS